ncbi:MAG: RpiB/LacA/LacB family sugar-phosphate isomerase [Candidatus Liptonbacteria bacterium]|nr:RpiB/LacA/LacB family sugar-phosphate isomerase [Candidatus Liptonbacteria bacterium]
MVIYFGADHRGFPLKEKLKAALQSQGYEIADMGATALDPADDYADFAAAVGRKVSLAADQSRGVLVCGSGAGVDFTANKFPRVRSFLGITPDQVYDARHDDDVNVLCISANVIDENTAQKMLETFLATPFKGEERHRRRLMKVAQVEEEVRGMQ